MWGKLKLKNDNGTLIYQYRGDIIEPSGTITIKWPDKTEQHMKIHMEDYTQEIDNNESRTIIYGQIATVVGNLHGIKIPIRLNQVQVWME